jgi:hypothetical protein
MKIQKKETKDGIRRLRTSYVHVLATLPRAIYRFSAIPIQIPIHFSQKSILKFTQKHKRSQIAKAILRKKEQSGIIIPDFKLYYRGIVSKPIWY